MEEFILPDITKRRKLFGLITIVSVVVFLILGINVYGSDPHIPLLMGAMVGTALAIIDGWKYSEIEKGMISTISLSMQAIMILLIIGVLIGSWVLGGIIQSLVYYGLNVINPQFFLITALLLCSVVSISTGSSWATVGTVGIVLIAIAEASNINIALAAGAIVGGAYFGDKLSPLSDTTNLAAGGAGTDVFTHIKSMVYTTIPNYVLCSIIYIVLGVFFFKNTQGDISSIQALQAVLMDSTNITLLTLLAPGMVLMIVAFKIPALPGLLGAALLGILSAIVLQGVTDLGTIIDVAHYGFAFDGSTLPEAARENVGAFYNEFALITDGNFSSTMTYFSAGADDAAGALQVLTPAAQELGYDPKALLDTKELLTRGGLDSMLWTVSLILCAMIFGGVLEKSGMLASVMDTLKVFTKTQLSLITTVSVVTVLINILASDQYIAIILPIRMFKPKFKELNISPRVQSRVAESTGTMTSALVPWNTCGATMAGFLGVPTAVYAPYAFFNWLGPVFEILAAATGYSMFKRDEDIAAGIIDGSL